MCLFLHKTLPITASEKSTSTRRLLPESATRWHHLHAPWIRGLNANECEYFAERIGLLIEKKFLDVQVKFIEFTRYDFKSANAVDTKANFDD